MKPRWSVRERNSVNTSDRRDGPRENGISRKTVRSKRVKKCRNEISLKWKSLKTDWWDDV